MQKSILFTKSGYEQKQKEYEQLLASRPDAVRELTKAREMGDLSENGYYKSARFKLSQIDRELRQLKHILKVGKVKEVIRSGVIDIGSVVVVRTGDSKKTYHIVGTYESDPSEGKISIHSPLGKLLMGKKEGDSALLDLGDKKVDYTIVRVT